MRTVYQSIHINKTDRKECPGKNCVIQTCPLAEKTMETQKKSKYYIAAAVLFGILTLLSIINLTRGIRLSFSYVIGIALYAFLFVVLVMAKRNILTAAAFSVLLLYRLYGFIRGFFNHSYFAWSWSYGSGSDYVFNFLLVIPPLLNLVGIAGITAIAYAELTDYLPAFREKSRKLWFTPALCIFVSAVLSMILTPILRGVRTLPYVNCILGAAILFSAAWIVYPYKLTPDQLRAEAGADGCLSTEAYCSLVKHVLLLMFTFGIWWFIWVYRVTRYLNCVKNEEPRTPMAELLLCMFVPFYQIFWVYKSAQKIDKLANAKNLSSDISTLCLIFAIICGFVAPIIMQNKMNSIITAKAGAYSTVNEVHWTQAETQAESAGTDVVEELMRYKKLLDSGVITQTEFEAMKKILLNL